MRFVCHFLGQALRRPPGLWPGPFTHPCIDVDHGVSLQAGLAVISVSPWTLCQRVTGMTRR